MGGSPAPRQPPFGARISAPENGSIRPVMDSRCLSADGIRFLGLPAPSGELDLPCGRLTGCARPHRGFHVPHLRDAMGEGVLSTVVTRVSQKVNAWDGPPSCGSISEVELSVTMHCRLNRFRQLRTASSRIHGCSPVPSSPSPVSLCDWVL